MAFIPIGNYRTGQDALTKIEYEKVLAVIDNFEDEVLIRLTVATGMRREDVVNVKISDLDFENKCLSFYEHKKRKIHNVPLPDNLIILIQRYLKTIKPNQEKLFNLCSKTAYNRFQDYCILAKIPKRPYHALRATCIKFCQAAGWTPTQTAELVDDTLRVIEGHYKTPSKAEMQQVALEKPFA
jgi:integrase